ncbi:MAG TPA: peptidoglycan-binding protein [Gaiellales bacterium]|nr:peptidoglycan-binding protein [Gaiellales bacterium]
MSTAPPLPPAAGVVVSPEPTRAARRRPSRRTLLVLAVLAGLVAVVVVVVATGVFGGGGKPAAGAVDNAFPTGVASVRRQSLSSQMLVSATLGYAGTSTIVAPAGTAPSDVSQARHAVANDEGTLQSARATLAADTQALALVRASLAAARAKRSVECAGVNSAQGASSSATNPSGACASDAQSVATQEQSLSGAMAKVAGDRPQVSAAERALAGDRAALAAAQSSSALSGQSSTFTTLPAVGQIVRRGQSLYAISGTPVVLFYGSVAQWRAFVSGMSAGRDVAELNANLHALGYGKGLAGNRFTVATAAAIRALQSAHGVRATGELLLGSVVFGPGPARVTSVTPTLGATVQPGPVLGITSTARQVTIALDAAQQAEIKVGDPVTITLPDNRTTPGKVIYVGTVATVPSSDQGGGGGSSTPTIEVGVTPSDPAATGSLDQAPVNVSIITASVKDALVVPVAALLALGSGGYAIEQIDSNGLHRLVAVELGIFDDADGLVQVSGAGLAAGQRIVVPGE